MKSISILTDHMRRAIGYESEAVAIEVDKTLIKRLADAVDDGNALWHDEAKAAGSHFGGIVAPPSLLYAALFAGRLPWEPIADLLPQRVLDAGGEWEFYQPIRVGDTITVVNRLADISERQGRLGDMLLVSSKATWRNQRREVVAKGHFTIIFYH